jgi:hypothetical protein
VVITVVNNIEVALTRVRVFVSPSGESRQVVWGVKGDAASPPSEAPRIPTLRNPLRLATPSLQPLSLSLSLSRARIIHAPP